MASVGEASAVTTTQCHQGSELVYNGNSSWFEQYYQTLTFADDWQYQLYSGEGASDWRLHSCANVPFREQSDWNSQIQAFQFSDSYVFADQFLTNLSNFRDVRGAIFARYNSLGGPQGFLGKPTTSETPTPDKPGRFNHFQGGSIYWSPTTGAWEVQGAIQAEWAFLGWENSFLGFPVTNENTTPNGLGKYNVFQGGSIYWSPQTGAHEIHGAIRDLWASMGWETSVLGFPSTDEYAIPGGQQQMFETRQNYPTADQYTIYGIDWTPQNGAWAWSNTLPYT